MSRQRFILLRRRALHVCMFVCLLQPFVAVWRKTCGYPAVCKRRKWGFHFGPLATPETAGELRSRTKNLNRDCPAPGIPSSRRKVLFFIFEKNSAVDRRSRMIPVTW